MNEADLKFVQELSMALHLINVTLRDVTQYGTSILATLRIDQNKNKGLTMTCISLSNADHCEVYYHRNSPIRMEQEASSSLYSFKAFILFYSMFKLLSLIVWINQTNLCMPDKALRLDCHRPIRLSNLKFTAAHASREPFASKSNVEREHH